jgi:hypothetical protein
MRGAVVTLDKLSKQLRRDMAANPKKAAALGLMVLVALYFWGPLVWRWVAASGNKRSDKTEMAALILTDDPAEPTQQTKARGGAKFRWEKVRQLIQEDRHMRSAAFDPTWTDPFGRGAKISLTETQTPPPAESATAAAASIAKEPEEFEIVLNGIFIGAKTRVATINGEPCYVGEMVALGDKDDTTTQRARVKRIERQAVVLEMNGRAFRIELNAAKLARGDEIERPKAQGH